MISVFILAPFVLTICFLIVIIGVIGRNKVTNEPDDADVTSEQIELSVAFMGDRAYWVHENVFYSAEAEMVPDFETTEPIDTENMSEDELNQLLFILDGLEEQTQGD